MALDFPASPTTGQKYPAPPVAGVPVYSWDGEKWTTIGGAMGSTGASDAIPAPDTATGAAGSSTLWSRGDHAHPTDPGIATGLALKADRAGDTMTGQLIVQSHISATSGGHIWSQTSPTTGVYQFGAGVANLTYDGSFYLSGGALNCSGDIRANSGAASPAIYYFGSGDIYWYYDGTKIQTTTNLSVGGDINCGANITATTNIGGPNVISTEGNVTIRKGSAAGAGLFIQDSTVNRMVVYHEIATGNNKILDYFSGGSILIDLSGAFQVNGAAYKPGGGVWSDNSDARIKNVEGEYTRGLDEVAALRPVFYTFKGNDTTSPPENTPMVRGTPKEGDPVVVPYPNSNHYQPAKAGKKFAGLVAQEVETVIPEMVTKRAGYIDGTQVTDLRDLDTTPLIFALVNSIKELKARVEALEAT